MDPDNYLADAYADGSDSHPNAAGNNAAGPAFAQFIVDSIYDYVGDDPDVNQDGSVDVIDLALVIFNLGADGSDPNYDHLDVDGDTLVDWDDAQLVMGDI